MAVSGRKGNKGASFSQSLASDTDFQLHCQPCKQDGAWVPAYGYCQDCTEHLCETCYKGHRKPAPCRNHILLDKSQMPQTHSSQPTPTDLTEICEQHQGRVIEYFCNDHHVLGCSPCMTLGHRTCKIEYIPDASEEYRTSQEYQNLIHSLRIFYRKFQKISEAAKENKDRIQKNKSAVKAEIQQFRNEINETLDRWEAEMYKEMERIFAEETKKADDMLQQAQVLVHQAKTEEDSFSKLEHDGNVNMLYKQGKKNTDKVRKYKSDEQKLQAVQINSVKFQPNSAIKSMLQTESALGCLLVELRKPIVPRQLSALPKSKGLPPLRKEDMRYTDITAESCGGIDVETNADAENYCITGLAMINSDKLAVADFYNTSIKIVNVKQKTVSSELKLSSGPWDVTVLPGNKLAVSLPRENSILIVSYNKDLYKVRQLKAGGGCYSLAYWFGSLVVTYLNEKEKVKILDLIGTVTKILYKETKQSPSRDFWYTTIDRQRGLLYVSETHNTHEIICFSLEGRIVGHFKDDGINEDTDLKMKVTK